MLHRTRRTLRAIFGRSTNEREMRDEMALHLERATERLIARGLSEKDARLAAQREFGNLGMLQEEARDARGARWIESVAADVRFAFRHFARRPLAAATIVLVLTLGIGVDASVFSLIRAIAFRPAPGVPTDQALVRIRATERTEQGRRSMIRPFSRMEIDDFAARREIFQDVAGWTTEDVALDIAAGGDAVTARAHFVTPNYFDLLTVRPERGPGLPRGSEPTGEPVVMIGHTLWQDRFGGDSAVIGTAVRINGVPARIVGVAPRKFNGALPTTGSRTLWMPLDARVAIARSGPASLVSRDSLLLSAIARLQPGVTLERASAVADVVAERAAATMSPRRGVTSGGADVVALRGTTAIDAKTEALVVGGIYGSIGLMILLVVCSNVSALVVGAAVARRREIAVRLSLGASRVRVIRQLLTESVLLSVTGGTLGLMVYWWIVTAVAARIPDVEMSPDWWTLAFTALVAVGTGIVFGLSPALHATRRDVADALRDSGAGATKRSRLQRVFVVAQIVFTQPLLVALAMMLFATMRESTQQIDDSVASRLMTLRLDASAATGSFAEKRQNVDAVTQAVRRLPGVLGMVPEAVGYEIGYLAVDSTDRRSGPGGGATFRAHLEATSPGYFKLLDIPIVRGRELVPSDSASADLPVVIGSDLAHRLWANDDPLGRRFILPRDPGSEQRAVVIGVFDSRYATTRGDLDTRVYTRSDGRLPETFLIGTVGPAAPLVSTVRALVKAELPLIPIERLETLASRLDTQRREAFQASAAAAAAGALALLMASIGLYGVVALAVGQRYREIGVRIALGARPVQVVAMLFAGGLGLSLIGLLIGLPLSLLALRIVASMVLAPKMNMLLVGGAILGVVVIVAMVATWIPARRAAFVDPVIALRND